jgi:hypothetical protein
LPLAIPTLADEIVVQNDSIEDYGEVYIVGDFIAGEHAGVRLTSPCDGTIVAVQIIWLEGTPGHLPSLEEAIHIYDGSTFPTPGDELELLEGPVLTPGYINEFRYLDEAQTVPLEVPVTAGQQFYVTLEFANPTDVGNGGPSVVRDIDGCHAGSNVLYGNIGAGWHWYDFCILLAGDLGIRAVVNCPGELGACCYADGSCANDIGQDDCEAEFGATWHQGLTCGEIICNPRGACCVGGDCLELVEPSLCDAVSGVYAGHGTDCAADVCVPGACCMADGECLEEFVFECNAMGGTFQGPGTSCEPNPCPQPRGACCFGEACAPDQLEANCVNAGGEWAGPWTDCADNDGDGVADACEAASVGDTDRDGDVDLADLTQLLAHYGQTSGAAWEDGDFDGDGDVDLTDLSGLLTNYGVSGP